MEDHQKTLDWMAAAQEIQVAQDKDIIRGHIVSQDRTGAWLDFGPAKSEAWISRKEVEKFEAETGRPLDPQAEITALVTEVEDDEGRIAVTVSPERIRRMLAWNAIREAYGVDRPVEAIVTERRKKGLAVEIAGVLQGFVPYSHLPRTEIEQHQPGDTLEGVMIDLEHRQRGRMRTSTVILSPARMRKLTRLEGDIKAAAALDPGDRVAVRVNRVQPYGLLVSLTESGLHALIPRSQVTRGRYREEDWTPDQELEAKILKVESKEERIRITCSSKACMPSPVKAFAEATKPRSLIEIEVVATIPGGSLIVRVADQPEVPGFIPSSQVRGQHPERSRAYARYLRVTTHKGEDRIICSMNGVPAHMRTKEVRTDDTERTKSSNG